MAKSISGTTKKRGRPKTTGKGHSINLRLQPTDLAAVDRWIKRDGQDRTRPDAIRHALRDWLIGQGIIKASEAGEGEH